MRNFLSSFCNRRSLTKMKRFFAIVTFLLISLLLSTAYFTTSTFSSAKQLNFYFYYPDSILTNLSRLTRYIDILFEKGSDHVSFQAFHHKVDFDRMFKITHPSLVLIPEWYYRYYNSELGVTPVLTPTRNGRTEYTKVLLVQQGKSFRLDQLSGLTIAMTPMGPQAVEHLNNELFAGQGIDFSACRIITVGKDANALFALALGQVDAAIVSADTITSVSQINNRVIEAVKVVTESQPVPLPLLCVLNEDKNQEDVKRITQLILDQAGQQILPEVMELLNIDGWQKITH